jgi:lipopolysaccharide export system permease protein
MMFAFLNTTLSRYLARNYVINFLALLAILLGVVFLFDTIELLRRAGKHDDVSGSVVIGMSLLKLPDMATIIAPFAILFSALYSFWQLSKRHELVILRSAGISAWQFLLPIILTAVAAGTIMVTVVNPLSALFYTQFSSLERKYLEREDTNIVAVFEQGLWLRQEADTGYAILHADKIDPDWRLRDVMVLSFDKNNSFQERLDAPSATLKSGNWVLRDAVLNMPGYPSKHSPSVSIPTDLTPQDIEESFSSPQAMGLWQIPSFIHTLESTGFDSTRVRIHFQSLLSQPFLYAAMVLLAACVALRPQRQGQSFLYVVVGVMTGFVVFLMSNFLQAMGSSHQLPVFLAAWSPALISSLFGATILLTLEDG